MVRLCSWAAGSPNPGRLLRSGDQPESSVSAAGLLALQTLEGFDLRYSLAAFGGAVSLLPSSTIQFSALPVILILLLLRHQPSENFCPAMAWRLSCPQPFPAPGRPREQRERAPGDQEGSQLSGPPPGPAALVSPLVTARVPRSHRLSPGFTTPAAAYCIALGGTPPASGVLRSSILSPQRPALLQTGKLHRVQIQFEWVQIQSEAHWATPRVLQNRKGSPSVFLD